MKSIKWMFAFALSFFVLAAGSALAQGNGHGKGHNKHGDDDDQGEHYYRDHTATFVDGMASIKAIFPPDWPRRTGCHQGWKDNWCAVASFRQDFRNGSNRVPRNCNGGYLRLLRTASTS